MTSASSTATLLPSDGSGSHLVDIDYLRGLAVALTGIAHVNAAFPIVPTALMKLYSVSEYWGGVYLFFVISGFVISRGFSEMLERAASSGNALGAWKQFYVRRFFRIVPTSTFWLVVTLITCATFNRHGVFGDFQSNIVQATAALAFVYNFIYSRWTFAFGIFWSLSLEEQFYAFFPPLHFVDRRIRYVALAAIIFALGFVHRPSGQFWVFVAVDALAWGVLIAAVHQHRLAVDPTFLVNDRNRAINQILCIAAVVLIPSQLKQVTCSTSLLATVCAWIVYCASFDRGYMRVGGDWMRRLGVVSFSVYLAHSVLLVLSKDIAISATFLTGNGTFTQNAFAFALAGTMIYYGSNFSYSCIEKPSRTYGRRLSGPSIGHSRATSELGIGGPPS